MAAYYPRRVVTIKDVKKAYPDLETWDDEEEDRLEHIQMYEQRIGFTVSYDFTDFDAAPKQEGKERQRRRSLRKVRRSRKLHFHIHFVNDYCHHRVEKVLEREEEAGSSNRCEGYGMIDLDITRMKTEFWLYWMRLSLLEHSRRKTGLACPALLEWIS